MQLGKQIRRKNVWLAGRESGITTMFRGPDGGETFFPVLRGGGKIREMGNILHVGRTYKLQENEDDSRRNREIWKLFRRDCHNLDETRKVALFMLATTLVMSWPWRVLVLWLALLHCNVPLSFSLGGVACYYVMNNIHCDGRTTDGWSFFVENIADGQVTRHWTYGYTMVSARLRWGNEICCTSTA